MCVTRLSRFMHVPWRPRLISRHGHTASAWTSHARFTGMNLAAANVCTSNRPFSRLLLYGLSSNFRHLTTLSSITATTTTATTKETNDDNNTMSAKKPSLVWIDCEMTGLLATDKLIEIAVIITDDELNIVAEVRQLASVEPLH